MTTQHTHPEFGDVDSQDVVEQHAPEMQETTDESAPTTASEQVEQSSQLHQPEDATPASASVTLTIPSLLSFTIPVASSTPSIINEGETVDAVQENQEHQEHQADNDISATPVQTEGVEAASSSEAPVAELQGDEVQASDIQPLSVDEVLPLEPASFALPHETVQEEQVAQETPDVQASEQPEPSHEQDGGTEGTEETLRPFTEYFEEFRQNEARSLFGTPDAFTEFAASTATTTPSNNDASESSQPSGTSTEEVLPPFDFGEGSSFIPAGDEPTSSATVNANETHEDATQSPMEAAISEEHQRVAAVEQEHVENTLDTQNEQSERPVSPLLRRDTRHRPRHSSSSHREEFVRSQGNEATPAEPVAQAMNEAQLQTPQAQASESAVETPVETPKPARRYRFDRPAGQGTQRNYGVSPSYSASTNGSTTAASTTPVVPTTSTPSENTTPQMAAVQETQEPQGIQETQTSSVSPATSQTAPIDGKNTTDVSTTPQEEQALKREAATIEQSATTQATSAPTEHGRRKHGQERQREKESNTASDTSTPTPAETMPTSVSDIAALVAEAHDALQGDVAPEDLPPLEYADLQKANSRRRRRHRNGTTVTTSIAPKAQEAKTQETPAVSEAQSPIAPAASQNVQPAAQQPQQVQQVATPRTPIQPVLPPQTPAQSNQSYTLTSGYTVNQMNQGNDATGPFMGPEPSPARGSVFTRDGRTTHAEKIRPSSYPSRDNGASSGGSISTAAMNHFANVVAQAIQVQSDRMVAEMRRVNQSPTNVSVSLPPFPSTERVGVFVDVANLLYSARTMRVAIDFGKLLDFLRGNRRLVRAQAYCPTSPQPGDEQMFLQAVKGLGYRITTKNYKTFASGAKKADLDLDLCMDVVRLVDGRAVDCIVLVSGDSDFMPMLDYCSDHGVRVEIAAFDEAMSATLRQSCDLFVNLSMLEEIRA